MDKIVLSNMNSFVLNNTTWCHLKTSELRELNITTPEIQRILEQGKVDSIVQAQLEFLRKTGKANFIGAINIHEYNANGVNKYYLTDGQHRYTALKQLLEEHSHDIETAVEIVSVDTLEQLKDNYRMINMNTPLPEFSLDIDKNIPEQAAQHFQEKYPLVWSKKARTKRPHMYFTHFQETLGYITETLQKDNIIIDHTDLIKIVQEWNDNALKWSRDSDKYRQVGKDMHDKALKWKFVLGLFAFSIADEYGYYWAKKIIEDKTGKIIKPISKKSRTGVPKKVKNDSWDKWVGRDTALALCIVCNVSEIEQKNFEAGHVIAHSTGGKATVDNIRPICSSCNKGMGNTNMKDWVQQHYPDNYNKFIENKYTIPNRKEQSSQMQSIFGSIF